MNGCSPAVAHAQEDLRRRVVYAVSEDGMSPALAAWTSGVCRQSVAAWASDKPPTMQAGS